MKMKVYVKKKKQQTRIPECAAVPRHHAGKSVPLLNLKTHVRLSNGIQGIDPSVESSDPELSKEMSSSV